MCREKRTDPAAQSYFADWFKFSCVLFWILWLLDEGIEAALCQTRIPRFEILPADGFCVHLAGLRLHFCSQLLVHFVVRFLARFLTRCWGFLSGTNQEHVEKYSFASREFES